MKYFYKVTIYEGKTELKVVQAISGVRPASRNPVKAFRDISNDLTKENGTTNMVFDTFNKI